MFTNKTFWQQLLNIFLLLTMLISTIVIYSSVIDLFAGPTYLDSFEEYKKWDCYIEEETLTNPEKLTDTECYDKYKKYCEEIRVGDKQFEIETIINGVVFILIPGLFLLLTNKYQRRSEKIGLMILDIALVLLIISGFIIMSIVTSSYLFGHLSYNYFFVSLLNGIGVVIFPSIVHCLLIRKSITKA
ncbi:hypothetical protein RJG79_10960 [Mycoplasmatota bacterium WC44]